MKRRTRTHPNQMHLFDIRAAKLDTLAERFSQELRRAADRAKKEEHIRIAVERQLEVIGGELDVRIEGKHEYTLLRGAVDSVYGSVFIEYKNPANPGTRLGPKLLSPGTRKVIDQINRRFVDVASKTGRTGAAMLGVGCDGRYFVFRRFVSGRITSEEPVEVSRWSARRFLWAIFNLGERGLALTPEFLAEDFGSDSPRGQQGISALAKALADHEQEPRVKTFFRQWKTLFGEVCGYDMDNPRGHLRTLSDKYGRRGDDPIRVLFALHTYYALFMKLLAAHVVSSFQPIGTSPLGEMDRSPSSDALRGRLRQLEDGDVYRHLGVTNFLEGDLFSWYLSAWTDDIEKAVRSIAARVLQYSPSSLRDNPAQARDLLKKLYQELVPRQVRHDLGEYYTPDWLAEQTLDAAGYDGDPAKRLLDPSCGSGTFLVLALARVRRWLERNFERAGTPQDIARAAAANIQGFDLNPLAVLAARTNFLIQFYDLFNYRDKLEVPIYLCDSVLTPAEYGDTAQNELFDKPIRVPTSAKMFLVPREVTTDRETLGKYCNILAEYARGRSGFSVADFAARCRSQGIPLSKGVRDQHEQLFADIRALDKDRRNGVWARFIKNAFAPVFLRSEPVDLVVGNPPWVNWESLPGRMEADLDEGQKPNYRQQIAEVFKHYGLFSLSGSAGRLGGGKKDLSMLFVYACVDHYLKDNGKLAFVITQTVFKTKGAGDGFRRFEYDDRSGESGRKRKVYVKAEAVDDLSDFQPFDGATNRTAIFVCRKSKRPTRYPAAYTVWSKTRRGRIGSDEPLEVVRDATTRRKLGAVPVNVDERASPWLTAPKDTLPALRKVIGKSDFRAHEGVNTGGLNGCYWVRVIRDVANGILIENLHDVGKIKVQRARCAVEPGLVHPLVRGRDVRRWHAEPSAWIILAQDTETRTGIPESEMRRRWPKTYAYFKRFEPQLRQRSAFRKYFDASDPFYSMYNVGPYTIAPCKVCWARVATDISAAVLDSTDGKPFLPVETATVVAFDDSEPAHYFCACMNSSVVRAVIVNYSSQSTGSFGSPHVLKHVRIPRFAIRNTVHTRLASLSRRAHKAAARGRATELEEVEAEIDKAAAKLWDLTSSELSAVRRALEQETSGRAKPTDTDTLYAKHV